MSHILDLLGDSENLGNWGKLNPLQEKARAINDLERRLEWLEERMVKEQKAWDAMQKNENIKAIYESVQKLRSYSPFNDPKKFDEALQEEITRTKELLLLKEIKDTAEAKPDIEAALFYLIDRKSEYHYPVKFTYLSEQEYLKCIEQYIQEMKGKAASSTPKNNNEQVKWVGKPSQLGFIISELIQQGYIEPPRKKDNEINYNELARQILAAFEVIEGTTVKSLSQSLNPNSENGQLTGEKKAKFTIPYIGLIN